jgi:peptide/nickel transport system substrate-binding protein
VLGALSAATGFGLRPAHAQRAAHAIAMHGEPAWGPGFSYPLYANPQAPKGGHLTHGVLGTFDCLNPFIVKGLPAANMRGYIVESLLARGYDEPFTLYGLLADSVATDAARSYVSFKINPAARFADGKPVTPADVIFSWELLRDKGRPNFRTYYIKITKAEATDARTVRFDLSGADDRELPLIIGLMPVLAKHAVNADTFEDTSFDPLLGSGPYTVSNVKPGESVTFTRDKNYWGRDLAINRGLWNFDRIRYDYYRDGNTHFEAFKKGLYDLRVETDPGRWQTAYDFPAMRDGRVVKEDLPYGLPKGMQGLVFNTRRSVFSDVRVREAILQLFDFEWLNRTYFFSLYKRTASYFDGCDLSAHGVPGDARASCWLHSRTSCGRTSWTAPGLRPLPTAQDTTVLCSAAPSRYSRLRVTSSRAPNCCIPQRDDRCRSKFSQQRAIRSVSRSPSSAISSVQASRRASVPSMPRNMSGAASLSTST